MGSSDAEPTISKESKALCTEYANASFDCGQHGDNRGASWQEVFAASEKARLAVESRIAELEQALAAKDAEIERLRLVEAPFNESVAPAGTALWQIAAQRAAITHEYIAAGQPPQKMNWLYGVAVVARLRAEAAEASLREKEGWIATEKAGREEATNWLGRVLTTGLPSVCGLPCACNTPELHSDACVNLRKIAIAAERIVRKFDAEAARESGKEPA